MCSHDLFFVRMRGKQGRRKVEREGRKEERKKIHTHTHTSIIALKMSLIRILVPTNQGPSLMTSLTLN